ncbi:MAG: T9SS type A sorting domain-containing protein [Chitinophagaceae bacterium]|nr:T9SS type A sorting domain-containing protein [Chitinophagaceae bacterium]
MLKSGGRLYLGGFFSTIGGQDSRTFFAAFSTGSTLPVQWTSFTANRIKNATSGSAVVCKWSTASEDNSAHFIIERSNNGTTFQPIGQVGAAGNSSFSNYYTFTDASPLNGTSYYRLKQVDTDTRFTFSKIVSVSSDKSATSFMIYPNPSNGDITMSFFSDKQQNGSYHIFDQSGKKLITNVIKLNKGANMIPMTVSSLPAGIYFAQVISGSGVKQSQFIKQ